jgi:hypothetical protein
VLGEQEDRVSVADVLHSPQAMAFYQTAVQYFPELVCELSWQTAEKTLEYRPIDVVARMAPRALLLIAAEGDDLCRAEHLRELHEQAGASKEFLSLEMNHDAIYVGDGFEPSAGAAVAFFTTHLNS